MGLHMQSHTGSQAQRGRRRPWPRKRGQGAGSAAACPRRRAVSKKTGGGSGGPGKGHTHKHAHATKKHQHRTGKHHPGGHHKGPWQTSGPPITVTSRARHHPRPRGWSPGWDTDCCVAEAFGTLLGLSDADVLGLYDATRDSDGYATIADTLEVAGGAARLLCGQRPAEYHDRAPGLILGVTLPQPHAIAVTPCGCWWSWGEPFNPAEWPELVVEEAWQLWP